MTFSSSPSDQTPSSSSTDRIEYIVRQQGGELSLFPAAARPTRYSSTQLRMAYELSKIDFGTCQVYWITVAYGSARQLDYQAASRDFDLLIGRLRREAKNQGSDLAVFDAQERDSGGSWHMHAIIVAGRKVMTRRSLASAWGRTIRCEADCVRVSCEAVRCEEELRPRKLYLLKAGSRHVQSEAQGEARPARNGYLHHADAPEPGRYEAGYQPFRAVAYAENMADACCPDEDKCRLLQGCESRGAIAENMADAPAQDSHKASPQPLNCHKADASYMASPSTESVEIPTLLRGCDFPDAVWHIRASESQLSRFQAEARETTVWLTRPEFDAIRVKYFPLIGEDARIRRLRRWVDEDSARFSAFSAWLEIYLSHQQQGQQPRHDAAAGRDDYPIAEPDQQALGRPGDDTTPIGKVVAMAPTFFKDERHDLRRE